MKTIYKSRWEAVSRLDGLFSVPHIDTEAKGLNLKEFLKHFGDYTGIERHNYFEHLTDGFNRQKTEMLLQDINAYYSAFDLDNKNTERESPYGLNVPFFENIDRKSDFENITNFLQGKMLIKHQPAKAADPQIPDALLNILPDLQQAGCIENTEDRPLKWLKSKTLLAYFVDVANENLSLKDSGERRKIKPFETLFNERGLTGCINEYKNKTGQLPNGYRDIDKLFKTSH
ncbi:MAG: hypothetical protein LBL07_11110 [Tannerella sp.]|jgi:hypothetical protein|nr:hypothetical protein [Tannerella sp.]